MKKLLPLLLLFLTLLPATGQACEFELKIVNHKTDQMKLYTVEAGKEGKLRDVAGVAVCVPDVTLKPSRKINGKVPFNMKLSCRYSDSKRNFATRKLVWPGEQRFIDLMLFDTSNMIIFALRLSGKC